jgi:hypothetical protein
MSLYSVAIYGHMYGVCSLCLKPFYSVSLYSYGLNDGKSGKALLLGPSIQYILIRTASKTVWHTCTTEGVADKT